MRCNYDHHYGEEGGGGDSEKRHRLLERARLCREVLLRLAVEGRIGHEAVYEDSEVVLHLGRLDVLLAPLVLFLDSRLDVLYQYVVGDVVDGSAALGGGDGVYEGYLLEASSLIITLDEWLARAYV